MRIRPNTGFTLIELLVTIVIIGILSKIAFSSYREFITRAERTDAKAVLLENAMSMEKLFTLNNTYGTSAPPLPFPQSPKAGKVKYTIAVESVEPTKYVLKAVPVDSSAKCGTFKIDNTGLRSVTSGTVDDCWGNG